MLLTSEHTVLHTMQNVAREEMAYVQFLANSYVITTSSTSATSAAVSSTDATTSMVESVDHCGRCMSKLSCGLCQLCHEAGYNQSRDHAVVSASCFSSRQVVTEFDTSVHG